MDISYVEGACAYAVTGFVYVTAAIRLRPRFFVKEKKDRHLYGVYYNPDVRSDEVLDFGLVLFNLVLWPLAALEDFFTLNFKQAMKKELGRHKNTLPKG